MLLKRKKKNIFKQLYNWLKNKKLMVHYTTTNEYGATVVRTTQSNYAQILLIAFLAKILCACFLTFLIYGLNCWFKLFIPKKTYYMGVFFIMFLFSCSVDLQYVRNMIIKNRRT